MAFNKRTWKGRQGTGLNKFSIDGATPVTVINQPDSITEQGDALSAGNLNDLEDRIYTAFEDEATAREDAVEELESADSNLKDAIQFNRKRIENLEQKSGSIVSVDYPEYSVEGEVPTGKATYAQVSKLRGVTVAWNEQVFNSQFADSSNWNTYANAGTPNLSISGGIGTITCNGAVTTPRFQGSQLTVTNGHTYLLMARARVSAPCNYIYVALSATAYFAYNAYVANPSVNTWYNIAGIYKSNLATDLYVPRLYFDGDFVNGDTMESSEIDIFDITQMFGSQVADYLYSIEQATAGAGVALFNQLVKALDNSAESGKLVSTTYESVGSIGFNRSDEQWENGLLNLTTGQPEPNASYSRSKNFCGCDPSKTYYLHNTLSDVTQLIILWYDINKSYLGYKLVQTNPITPLPNAYYFKFRFNAGSVVGTLCFNVSQPNTSISPHDGEYLPYMTDSLPLPTSVTLRGLLKVDNGNLVVDGDEYEPESGDVERKYGIVDLGDLDWNISSATTETQYVFYSDVLSDAKKPLSDSDVCNILCGKYTRTATVYLSEGDKRVSISATGRVNLSDNSYSTGSDLKTALAGIYLLYEKATPTSDTPLTPINDPTLATEGGGSLSTTQTNDPAIVSGITVTYLTL